MRSFVSSLGIVTIAASIVVPSSLSAQRNVRRSAPRAATSDEAGSVTPAASHCRANCGAYSLAVVSAVLPSETEDASSDVVTLVIENRGGLSAPVATISVAPRNHLTLARRTTIPALAPGERTTVELPVSMGPDGTQCISITITPSPVSSPSTARFLASAISDPQIQTSGYNSWEGDGSFGEVADFADFMQFGRFGEGSDW
jgi:hypothetical protein